jgi:peptidoglycan/xylan/chitin deacetylase (PgdA/CDA1 family)
LYLENPNIKSLEQQIAGAQIEVKEIPIPLGTEMDTHLREFRIQAQTLQSKFPDSFIISGLSAEKLAALTFDDGPDGESTEKIASILDSYGVPGTFFFVGQHISRYERAYNAVLLSSHEIGNHSWSHLRPTELSIYELLNEVDLCQAALNAGEQGKKLYRPPFGLVTQEQMAVLDKHGYTVVAWSVDSMDWYFDNPEDIARCVIEAIHPGAIILLHSAGGKDNRTATIEALPVIIENLKSQGYKLVTVNELIKAVQ